MFPSLNDMLLLTEVAFLLVDFIRSFAVSLISLFSQQFSFSCDIFLFKGGFALIFHGASCFLSYNIVQLCIDLFFKKIEFPPLPLLPRDSLLLGCRLGNRMLQELLYNYVSLSVTLWKLANLQYFFSPLLPRYFHGSYILPPTNSFLSLILFISLFIYCLLFPIYVFIYFFIYLFDLISEISQMAQHYFYCRRMCNLHLPCNHIR